MPWTPEDAQNFTREADTPEKRRLWARIANSTLARCEREGGKHDECAAQAIRVANAAIARRKSDQADVRPYGLSELTVQIKGFNESERTVWGYANVAVVDNGNPPDFIEAEAWPGAIADFLTRPLLLLMHQPINAGEITALKINRRGLWIKARVTLAQAWEEIKSGRLRGFSIGWLPLPGGYEFKKVGDRLVRFVKRLFLFEISLVDRPMNPESLIEGVEEKMIKDEQIQINRQTGEIVVSGLTEEQMAEFMSVMDMLLGNAKAWRDLPNPTTLIFKCATANSEPEQSFFERLKHILPKQEEPMDLKQIETSLQSFEERVKALEDSVAKLPETAKSAVSQSVAEIVKQTVEDALKAHAQAAATAQAEAEKQAKAQAEERKKALEAKRESLVKFLKELGVPEESINETVEQMLPASEAEQKPEDVVTAMKAFMGAMNKRLDDLENTIAGISQGSVTQRIRQNAKSPNPYRGLPGSNLVER